MALGVSRGVGLGVAREVGPFVAQAGIPVEYPGGSLGVLNNRLGRVMDYSAFRVYIRLLFGHDVSKI